MRERDAQIGLAAEIGLAAPRARIEPRDPDPLPAHVQHRALVEEERRRLELTKLDRLREGVAADGEIVVTEDRVAALQALHQLAQERLARRPGDEIAGEDDDVRIEPGGPVDASPDRHPPA